MDIALWITVLGRSLVGVLAAGGKNQQAELLNDALSALREGRNVDDLMRKYAEDWEANGEPSFESIAATRQSIQDRM
jgi:hypothetical protein